MKIKPSILAKALHISTDGLRKQRIRGNSPYEYEIIEGRVFYNTHTLPPSVREWCENFTSKKTRTPHKQNNCPLISHIMLKTIRGKTKFYWALYTLF
jgi:hypothetical protein